MIKFIFYVFSTLSTFLFFKTTAVEDVLRQGTEIIEAEEFVDARDGEIYKTMMIGDKRWFIENLRYDVPGVVTGFDYVDTILSLEGLKHYGRLYDWRTVMNQKSISESEANLSSDKNVLQGICPKGWHVSSDEDWKTLEKFLGMEEDVIEMTSLHRRIPNIENVVSVTDWITSKILTSESLLKIFPTGKYTTEASRMKPAGFYHLGERATFWTSTESSDKTVWGRTIKYDASAISRYDKYQKRFGYACRCVED